MEFVVGILVYTLIGLVLSLMSVYATFRLTKKVRQTSRYAAYIYERHLPGRDPDELKVYATFVAFFWPVFLILFIAVNVMFVLRVTAGTYIDNQIKRTKDKAE